MKENTLFKQGNPLSVKYTAILSGPDKFTNTVNNYMIQLDKNRHTYLNLLKTLQP